MAPVGMLAVIWVFGVPAVSGSPGRLAEQPPWSILPAGETPRAIRPCSRSTPPGLAGSWIPKVDDVILAEASVDEAVAASVKTLRKDLRPRVPLQYYRSTWEHSSPDAAFSTSLACREQWSTADRAYCAGDRKHSAAVILARKFLAPPST
jgi:hypothetical protein